MVLFICPPLYTRLYLWFFDRFLQISVTLQNATSHLCLHPDQTVLCQQPLIKGIVLASGSWLCYSQGATSDFKNEAYAEVLKDDYIECLLGQAGQRPETMYTPSLKNLYSIKKIIFTLWFKNGLAPDSSFHCWHPLYGVWGAF